MCKESLNISQQKAFEKMMSKINQLENELIEQQEEYKKEIKELRNMNHNLCSDYQSIKNKYMKQSTKIKDLEQENNILSELADLRESEAMYLYKYIQENDVSEIVCNDSQGMSDEEYNQLAKAYADAGIECDD